MGDELWNDNPGPGAYCVKDTATITQAPIYTIGKKLNFDDDDARPGPGTYSPQFLDAGPSYSLPARLPGLSKDDSMPGPGTYSSHTRYTQSCPPAYSIAVRLGDAASSKNNPGPGTYTPHLTPGGPSFSLRARSDSDGALDRNNPGLEVTTRICIIVFRRTVWGNGSEIRGKMRIRDLAHMIRKGSEEDPRSQCAGGSTVSDLRDVTPDSLNVR